jgi:P-type Ca2+ transporter type 2C
MLILATELPGLQKGLLTTELTGKQWFACIGLALLLPITVETRKWLLRRNAPPVAALDVQQTVSPQAARTAA